LRPNWSSTSEVDGVPSAGRRRWRTPCPGSRQQLDDLLADPVEVGAELDQHLGGDALALADEPEQDVLGADVVVAELQRLAQRELEHLLGARREGDVAARGLLALADDLLDLVADALEGDAEGLERLRGDALALVDQAEQDVLGPDVVVVEHPGLFLGQDDHPTGSVGETLEHEVAPHGAGDPPTAACLPRTLAPARRPQPAPEHGPTSGAPRVRNLTRASPTPGSARARRGADGRSASGAWQAECG
jgi:hypothetical protein